MAEEKKELVRIMAGLEKEAEAGSGGIRWGGGMEPKTIRPNDVFTTGKDGIGVTLWDGSEIRVGPDSKAVVGDCGPGRECRQTLENGLLYFESGRPPVEGMAIPAIRGVVIATEALSVSFPSARLVVFASGGSAVVAVLEGRVKAVTSRGETAIIAPGETFEARKGEPSGDPRPAEMEKLNKWWEVIR
jgi:ferric-dicitrate binding protein FerR (iron transport regulator)